MLLFLLLPICNLNLHLCWKISGNLKAKIPRQFCRFSALCPNLFSEQVWQHWLAFRKRTRLRLRSRTAVATATHFHDCAAAAARHATCRDFQIRCASEFVLTVVGQPNCDSDSDGNNDVSRVRVCLLSQLLGLSLPLLLSALDRLWAFVFVCVRTGCCLRWYACACVIKGLALALHCCLPVEVSSSSLAHLLSSLSSSLVLLLSCLIAKLYEYVL